MERLRTQGGLLVRLFADRNINGKLDKGEYRLDLDPVGYSINLKPIESAYAVQVTPGSYTKLNIPFT